MATLFGNKKTGEVIPLKIYKRLINKEDYTKIVDNDYTYAIWRVHLPDGTYKFPKTKNMIDETMRIMKQRGWELLKEENSTFKVGDVI
ncbi:hypothetical protein [Brevibacillus agri]|uniref:hypothetical protein n=1 Tax=Brevibacillus agri TaxID=51101 RepID=UPI003D22F904